MGQNAISISLFCVLTGRSDKSVRDAIKSLEELNVVVAKAICKEGTFYTINWDVLGPQIDKLNAEKSPVERMRIADGFRGVYKALHTKAIEQYSKSMFNN